MTTRIEEYSVGQLARLSGVTIRTLHHYDEIGLLKPAHIGENGYRFYHRSEALRLQEILFYRDVGLSLSEIADFLDGPLHAVQRLERHRDRMAQQHRKAALVIETLNATINHLKGKRDMAISDLYKPFTAEKQAEYEAWLIDEYGAAMAAQIADSKAAIDGMPDGVEGTMGALRSIESQLVSAFEMAEDVGSDRLHALFEQHRSWVAQMWGKPCDADSYQGLAEMYRSHPDFVARYETLAPRFSGWLVRAMTDHVGRLRNKC